MGPLEQILEWCRQYALEPELADYINGIGTLVILCASSLAAIGAAGYKFLEGIVINKKLKEMEQEYKGH